MLVRLFLWWKKKKISFKLSDQLIKKENNFMQKLIPTIRKNLKTMTKKQQAISRFITESSDKAVKVSISQLAEACGAKSEATIVRYYRQLGLVAIMT